MCNRSKAFRPRPDVVVSVLVQWIMAALVGAVGACANGAPTGAASQGYGTSAPYQSMLHELAREAPRPSRISDAGYLLHAQPRSFPVESHETDEGLTLETAFYHLEVSKNPFRLWWVDKATQVRWGVEGQRTSPSGILWERKVPSEVGMPLVRVTQMTNIRGEWVLQCSVGGRSEPVSLRVQPVTPSMLRVSVDGTSLGKKAWLHFYISGEGPFFGLGEQYVHANLAGFKINLHPNDRYGTPGHDWDYMSIPFIYGPRGLGVYFDTAYTTNIDVGAPGQGQFSVQIQASKVDCYLFAGKGPAQVLEEYTGLTGRTPVPPPWAFGVWHNSLEGADAVLADARRLRAEKIPVSALWISDMMDDVTNLGWPLWTVGYYGPPGKFNDQLHQLGFKVLGYVHPYVRAQLLPYLLPSPLFQYAVEHHFLVTGPKGQPAGPTFEPCLTGNIDFTKPEAVNWWQGMIDRILTDFHFDGWMEDFGEWVNDNDRFAAGKSGRVMATLNPLFYHKITYQIAHRINPNVVEFSRSGAPGSQAFTPVLWGGDQLPNWSKDNGLPAVVTAGITAGLSGFDIWGPDILSSGTSKELWIRWMEFGALTPIMRDHLWNVPKFAVDLWFDPDTTDEFRSYARLHISLFPYFYTFAQRAAKTGLPIMRHLMLAYPRDPNTYAAEYEYLLGDRILVAPVIEAGATMRQLYLPEGSWVDYWTSHILEGRRDVTVSAPLDHIPILVKAGTVIPFISRDTQTLAPDLAGGKHPTLGTGLTWRVFPSASSTVSSFDLYDGSTVMAASGPDRIRVQGSSPIIRAYRVDVPADAAPRAVLLNGVPLGCISAGGFRAAKKGWWFDRHSRALRASFLGDHFVLEVTPQ